jgi:ABC-type sugar transport system permease subunit
MAETVKKKKISKRTRRKYVFIVLMIAWPLANFAVFYVWVNFNSILMAFQRTDNNFNTVWVGLDNFKEVLRQWAWDGNLVRYLKTGLYLFAVSFIIGFPLNILFAYLFFMKIRGVWFMRFCILIPAMISGLASIMLFSKFADHALPQIFNLFLTKKTFSFLTDDRFNLHFILIFSLLLGFSYNIVLYNNAMNAIENSVIEAARSDGASNLQILLKIVVPNIYPTMSTFLILGFAGIFSADPGSLFGFYQYGAPENVMTLGYYLFNKTMSNTRDYSYAATMGIIFTLINLPIVMTVKFIVDGLDPLRDAVDGDADKRAKRFKKGASL